MSRETVSLDKEKALQEKSMLVHRNMYFASLLQLISYKRKTYLCVGDKTFCELIKTFENESEHQMGIVIFLVNSSVGKITKAHVLAIIARKGPWQFP
jgi:hypothetical protein